MKKPFSIPSPCSEDWNKMKIGIDSRFCDSCHKNVVDFRHKSRQEILEYLLSNYDKKICGHIYESQLDYNYSNFIVAIDSISKKTKSSNLPFYLLSLGAMLLLSNETAAQTTNHKTPQILTQTDTTKKCSKHKKNDSEILDKESDLIVDGEIELLGDIDFIDENAPRFYADTMPEFPGGIDSLHAFIQKNIVIPEYEKKRNIKGTVYATFVINTKGEIENIRILKSVKDSKQLNQEVIRILNIMPNWKPGIHYGKKVDVHFNLPFKFK